MATLQQALKKVAPQVDAARWAPALAAGFAKFGVNTNKRVAAAVGQFLSEAGSAFQELEEHLYYTHAERLHAVFPKEFATVAAATPYLKNPEKLGDFVYANRNGNGNVASGDGYLFRGRGLIQITGRKEYTALATALGVTPAQAANDCLTTDGAAMSGCWYLATNGCLPKADKWDIDGITLAVNGKGMRGAAQRLADSHAMLVALS
jgi:predicted chitinase